MSVAVKAITGALKSMFSDLPSDNGLRLKRKNNEPVEVEYHNKFRRLSNDHLKSVLPSSYRLSSLQHGRDTRMLNNRDYMSKMVPRNTQSQPDPPQLFELMPQRKGSAYFCTNQTASGSGSKERYPFDNIELTDDDDDQDDDCVLFGSNRNSGAVVPFKQTAAPPRKMKLPNLIPLQKMSMVNGGSQRPGNVRNTFKPSKPAAMFPFSTPTPFAADERRNTYKEQYQKFLEKCVPSLFSESRSTMGAASTPTNQPNLSSSTVLNRSHNLPGRVVHLQSIPCIDLSLEKVDSQTGERKRTSIYSTIDLTKFDPRTMGPDPVPTPPKVEPINTLLEQLQINQRVQADVVENVQSKYRSTIDMRKDLIAVERERLRALSEKTREHEGTIERKMGDFMLKFDTIVLDEDEPEEEEDEIEYPVLTDEHQATIKRALYGGPRTEMIISKFNLSITRTDLATLIGENWLNDEVINFYMNLLMERSEKRADDGFPRVYAMNTFFVPKLLSAGHIALRRWTRKVDIFSYDVIPVPVHVGSVHWCMAIIHLKNRTIRYYDSMGAPNNAVLNALEQYLRDESMDKKKQPFDSTGFVKENMRNCPKQMNGSDCGVFSCMFAEYITRNREITFSQAAMPYFRQKMIFEIAKGTMMT